MWPVAGELSGETIKSVGKIRFGIELIMFRIGEKITFYLYYCDFYLFQSEQDYKWQSTIIISASHIHI